MKESRELGSTSYEERHADVIGPFPMDCGMCSSYLKNRFGPNEVYDKNCEEHKHLKDDDNEGE